MAGTRPITIDEGEPYEHILMFPFDVSDREFQAQLRDAPGGSLIGEFSFSDPVDNGDGTWSVTATLPAEACAGWVTAWWSARWLIDTVPHTFVHTSKATLSREVTTG